MLKPILKTGSYYVRFRPAARDERIDHYDGVLRVTREDADGNLKPPPMALGDTLHASADLYAHHRDPDDYPVEEEVLKHFVEVSGSEVPKMSLGVPYFPRTLYQVFLHATEVRENMPKERHVMARIESHRYDHAVARFVLKGRLTAILKQGPDDPANPLPGDAVPDDADFAAFVKAGGFFLRGEVYDENAGIARGVLQVAKSSDALRDGHMEIDCVASLPAPMDNLETGAKKVDWPAACKGTCWNLEVEHDTTSVIEAPGSTWGDPIGRPGMWYLSELHQVMVEWRRLLNLEKASRWNYYTLCVHDIYGYERGVSFDAGVDLDNIPDQIIALGAKWKFPDEPRFGSYKNKFLKDTGGYFRTAVHEAGHAMGLGHNHDDACFMNTTDAIAGSATATHPFPKNIQWHFALKDQARLRHLPDPAVRPDMVYRGEYLIHADDDGSAEGVRLIVRPHLNAVAYGAAVRVEFVLENTGKAKEDVIHLPKNLSLKSGHVYGVVRDPQGHPYRFKPVATRLDEEPMEKLMPGKKAATRSLTLLRGPDGALFKVPGWHEVHIGAYWFDPQARRHYSVWGSTRVNVTPPADEFQRVAALGVLGSQEALLRLAVGGDHLASGQRVLDAALEDGFLRPHWGIVECHRWIKRFQPFTVELVKKTTTGKKHVQITRNGPARPVELRKAFSYIDRYTVCAIDEIIALAQRMAEVKEASQSDPGPLAEPATLNEFLRVAGELNTRVDFLISHGRIDAETHGDTIQLVKDLCKP